MSNMSKHGGVGNLLSIILAGREVLEKAYIDGGVAEDFSNAGKIARLCDGRALIRTARGYRVHPKLESFFNYFLETETSQYLDTQHAERIPEIKELCERYLDFRFKDSNKTLQDETFNLLEAVVYEVIMDLEESCRRLRSRVEDDFGYGKTLAQKRSENEKAINQAERLVNGLKSFSFQLMAELASDCTELNSLLCGELHPSISRCQADLEMTMERLRALMLKYREREKDRDLISSFNKFLDKELEWAVDIDDLVPSDGDEVDKIALGRFHVVEELEIVSQPDIDDYEQDDALTGIVEAIYKSSKAERETKELGLSDDLDFNEDVPEQEVEIDVLDVHCDTFFAKVCESEGELSASEYYESDDALNCDNPLQCSIDVWLFGVMTYYGSMMTNDKKDFTCEAVGRHTYMPDGFIDSYGNKHLEDVYIGWKLQ